MKWAKIIKEWKYEKPKYFFSHWFHDTFNENNMWWKNVKHPRCLCRTCKVWWRK